MQLCLQVLTSGTSGPETGVQRQKEDLRSYSTNKIKTLPTKFECRATVVLKLGEVKT